MRASIAKKGGEKTSKSKTKHLVLSQEEKTTVLTGTQSLWSSETPGNYRVWKLEMK